MHKFYVYVIFRLTGEPCYVGKGCRDRWLRHFKPNLTYSNKRLTKIITEAGGSLPIVKIRENITNDDAIQTEIALIAAIGRGKRGPLVNLTDGGEGTSGVTLPAYIRDVRRRNAEKQWGDQAKRDSVAAKARLRWADPNFREKCKQAQIDRWRNLTDEDKSTLLASLSRGQVRRRRRESIQ